MPRQAVTDPELLRLLNESAGDTPVTTSAPPARQPVTDPSLLSQLEGAAPSPPVQTSALAEASPLERTATRMRSALAEVDRITQPGAMERMGKEGFVPSVAPRMDARAAARMPGVVARGTKLAYQKLGSALRQVVEDEKAWLAQKAAESHAAGGYGLTPEQTQAAIQEDLARGGLAEVRSASAQRRTRRLAQAMEENIPEDAGFIERNIEQGLISSAVTAPTVLTGALLPGAQIPALVAMSGQAAAGRYAELVAQGVDQGEAAKSALLLGPLEGLTEKMPLGALAKKSPAVKQLFEFLVKDLAGEEISTIAELADDYRLGLADNVTASDVKQALLDTAAQTTVAAGAQVGAVQAIRALVDRANALAQAREPSIETPSDEEIRRNLGQLDDESLTDEQLDQQIEQLERELAGETVAPAEGTPAAPDGTEAASRETPSAFDEKPDVDVTFEADELAAATGPIPEDQVAIQPSSKRPGWYVITVNGEPHVEVPTLKQAEDATADLIRGPEAAQAEAPAAPSAPLTLEERLMQDIPLRRSLEFMANEAGWAEVGGRLIRGSEDPNDPNYNTIVGRTRWIPRAEWWPDRPKGFNEQRVRATVAKALDGEKLSKPERRLIEFMVEVSDERSRLDEFVPQVDELPDTDQDLDSAFESAMVARAIEIDEGTVERLAIRYESDTLGFLKAVKRFLDGYDDRRLLEGGAQSEGAPSQAVDQEEGREAREARSSREAVSAARQPGPTADLFGQDTRAAQELADEIRRRDAKRSPNKDVPLETGDPSDLFSQARRQVDLTDVAPPARKEPTPAQIAAGNYPKVHKRVQGLPISIENEQGSTRKYTDPDGNEGERVMRDDYGYIRGYKDNTGEHVDVFVGPHEDSDRAFVIDQVIDGKFDEPKTLLGYRTEAEARTAYLRNYQPGWKGLGAITEMSIPEFKEWLESGGPTKPLAWRPELTAGETEADRKDAVANTVKLRESAASYEGAAIEQRPLPAEVREDPSGKRAAAPGRRDVRPAAGVQLDIFQNAAKPEPAARAARLLGRTKHIETGSFKTSLDRINNWQDAAHLIAPLRKSPQEQMLAIVLDKSRRPLAVVRHSVGVIDASNVDAALLNGTIVRIPGAAQVYYAHNHPSGQITPSQDDEIITRALARGLEGTGIEPVGMIIVGPNRTDATFFAPGGADEQRPIRRASRRKHAVPQIERRWQKIAPSKRPYVASQFGARLALQQIGEPSGVLMLDNRRQVLGVLPMELAEMRKLRTNRMDLGAARVLATFAEANANRAIVFGPIDEANQNVATFLLNARIDVFDTGIPASDGSGWVMQGVRPRSSFLSESPAATRKPAALEQHRQRIEAYIAKRLAKVKGAPKVTVLRRITDVPEDVQQRYALHSFPQSRVRGIEGMYDEPTGNVYLFSDALTARWGQNVNARAAWVLFHEYAGHHGLRAAAAKFGININTALNRALDNPFVRELGVAIARQRRVANPEAAADEALAELAAAVRTGDYQHIEDRYGLTVPQAQRKTLRGAIARLIQAIKLAIARWTGAKTAELSDGDIYELLTEGWEAVTTRSSAAPKRKPRAMFSEAPPIESEAFKRWFGDSKVVDAEGRPLVVYHGTAAAAFEAFDRDAPGTHIKLPGNFFTPDRRIAENFAQSDAFRRAHRRDPMFDPYEGQGQTIIPVYLSLQNPIEIDVGGKLVDAAVIKKALEQAERDGHDGAIIRNWPDGSGDVQYSVFRPEQIKSAIGNRGTFDPNDPSIIASEAPPAPPFFSALTRAAETAKTAKASAEQWLATLRNTPGVKREEIEWSGVEEWLKSLGRPATREELVEFLRANEVQIEEVLKGGGRRSELQKRHDDLVVRMTAEGFSPDEGDEWFAVEANDGSARYSYKEPGDYGITEAGWYRFGEATEVRLPPKVEELAFEIQRIRRQLDTNEDDGGVRYQRWAMPGGENYRELLLTIPGESRPAMSFEEWADARGIDLSNADDVEALRDSYRRDARHFESGNVFHSSHWNEPNILAHIRFDERTDQDGKRVLFIQEIQSDWHQTGRRKGYRLRRPTPEDAKKFFAISDEVWSELNEEQRQSYVDEMRAYPPNRRDVVPDAPLKTTWPEFAFKRMLRWAAENGFDRIAWTTGEQQADRYDLTHHINAIAAAKRGDGWSLSGKKIDGGWIDLGAGIRDEDLTDYVGKDLAKKIIERGGGKFTGVDLKVGGEGMVGFYDKMLPAFVNKYTKKWGGKVGQTYLAPTGAVKLLANDSAEKAAAIGAAPVHSLDITPAMRQAALAGQPLFSEAPDPRLERLERLKALRAQRHAIQAGASYVPMYQGGQVMPLTATTVTIGTGDNARTLAIPKTPIRREHIMAQLMRDFEVKVYQGKPFRGRMLGFFRPSNFEVRIKHKNDLEVTAHEIFHWLDETYPELNRLYHQKRFDKELRSISYDAKKLHEGFAEFGRLFLTQDAQAVAKVPNFYAAFVQKAQELGIYERLAKIQDRMHQWYMQGALARARSKVGHEAEPLAQRMGALADVWADRAAAESVDYLHAAKVIERTLTGTIAADAMESPYKSLRLLAGARNTIEAFLNHGTLNWTPRGLEFTGKGLKHVFEPVANHMDDTLAYFIGRRAEELMKYGKERLFTPDEIGALLDAGRTSPKAREIEQAFNEYQAYVDRLMDFAEASGIVSGVTRALWKAMYQNYVPFYRVSETLGTTRLSGPSIKNPFKRLFGGTANLNDIWDNMVMNTATIVHASLRNMAKRQLFDTIERSPLGQRFAVRIPTETTSVKVGMTQVEQVLRGLLNEAEQRALDPNATAAEKAHYAQVWQALDILTSATNAGGGAALEAMQEQATFYVGGQPPSIPDKDSILVNGERVWFQIADPLMWDMLADINYHKPVGLLEVVFGAAKRTLTRGVTITPEFQFANIIRDTLNAFTMSRGRQVPLMHAVRAMGDIVMRNEDYKLFLANGGGFGNATPVNEGRRVRMHMRKLYQGGRVNIRAILDTPAKLLDFWDRWGQAFELGTRLAEFKLVRKRGGSLREAAFQGREISSDFAMHGRAKTMKAAMISLPFFNARIQGLYRLERELFERHGRQSWRGERQLQYAMRGFLGITVPSLILYFWNKDDEDYKALSDETKYLYYPIKIPNTHDFVLIPKPFETGALFSTIPEQMWQYAETRNERKLMDAAAFTLIETFAFDPIPQVARPGIEWYANRDWRGLPIVPRSLENVEPREQYRWNTSPTLIEVGKRFDVSPIALDHFLRGYLGGVSGYLTMASDSLVTSERWGERPTRRLQEYPVLRRFLREAPYTSTSYQREFWDLYREVDRTVNTARKIRKEFRQDDLEAYLGDTEKIVLFSLKGLSERVAERAREISAAQVVIRRDPEMSAEQKRKEIDALQEELNGLFREVVRTISPEQLEQYRDALEGLPPQASSREVFEAIAPMIEGKTRRQQVASLKAGGYPELAALIASLPPTPDKEARQFFAAIGESS